MVVGKVVKPSELMNRKVMVSIALPMRNLHPRHT